MRGIVLSGWGLLTSIMLTSAGTAVAKPPLENVRRAQQKVAAISNHLSQVIARAGQGGGGGFPGGGGGDQINQCAQYRSYRACVASGCNWQGNLEVGRCIGHRQGGHGGHIGRGGLGGFGGHGGPRFFGENDVAAQLAATGMKIGMETLNNDLLNMAMNYYSPIADQLWWKACDKSRDLLIANQGAKVAAALPQVGFYQPQFFEYYDRELVGTRQLLYCN